MKWILVMLCLIPTAAQATEVTPALMRACAGDARRLCAQHMRAHDIAAVRLCMAAAASQVSVRCALAWRASQGS